MDTLGQIGGIASLGSLILSRPAQIRRGADTYDVRAVLKKAQMPYRANENRRPYDALIRLDRQTSPVEPQQNDVVLVQGLEWLVWRILPSSAGSHWVLECMAPPSVGVIPVRAVRVPDGMGGRTTQWTEELGLRFLAKVREANLDRQLSAETSAAIGRLSMVYRTAEAPANFGVSWRVSIDGLGYEVVAVTVDDENPFWRNAVLVREGST